MLKTLWKRRWEVSALLAATLLVYWPALHAGFIWDDHAHAGTTGGWRRLFEIWFVPTSTQQYYPLTFTAFWLQARLWAGHAAAYHAVNILFHAANAILLGCVLEAYEVPAAWAAAALFALHPVEVETVAWVSELKSLLSGCFCLLSLHALESSPLWRSDAARPRADAALLFFVAALASKTVACTLPGVMLLLWWWKGKPLRGRVFAALAPYVLIGGLFGFGTSVLEKDVLGANGMWWDWSFAQRLLLAGHALFFYAGKLLWPRPLMFFYPRWPLVAGNLLAWLYPASAAAILLALWAARGRIGKGPFVAAAAFAGTLFPALGFFNVYPMRFSYVADHFQYAASMAALAFAAAGAETALERFGLRRAGLGLLLAVCLVFAARVRAELPRFHDEPSLWADTAAKNPACAIAQNNLAGAYFERGDLRAALEHVQAALAADASYGPARVNLALVEKRLARQKAGSGSLIGRSPARSP